MHNKSEIEILNETIALVKLKQIDDLRLLQQQINLVYERIKPINIIKNTWNEITTSANIKNNLLDSAIGLTTGFVSKKIMIGNSHNPIKNMLGTLLQYAVTNAVSKHAGPIKFIAENLIAFIAKKARK